VVREKSNGGIEMPKLSKKNMLIFIAGFGIGIVLLIFVVKNTLDLMEQILTPQPPEGFNSFFTIKKEKTNKEGYIREFIVKKPAAYLFFVAPNFNGNKIVKFISEKRLIGLYTNEIIMLEKDYGSSQVFLLLLPGSYKFFINFDVAGASIFFYTNVIELSSNYVNRILKIDRGEIYNPPEGFRKFFATNLNGLDVNNLSAGRFEVTNPGEYSFCAYSTMCKKGRFSLRLVGGGYQGVDILNEKRTISDQVSLYLNKGKYEILLSSYEADCDVVLYITNAL
jgi:hypothetical protein